MTSTFKLDASPTFKAKVDIPVHGSASVPVEFEFKHRTKDDLAAWLKTEEGEEPRSDLEMVKGCVVGWELDDPFNDASINKLLQNYAASAVAITNAYISELYQARLGN